VEQAQSKKAFEGVPRRIATGFFGLLLSQLTVIVIGQRSNAS